MKVPIFFVAEGLFYSPVKVSTLYVFSYKFGNVLKSICPIWTQLAGASSPRDPGAFQAHQGPNKQREIWKL